jgi:hypothetical protein
MTVGFLPTIKRFFAGTVSVVATHSGDARGHVRHGDFMTQDLTGSARFYVR